MVRPALYVHNLNLIVNTARTISHTGGACKTIRLLQRIGWLRSVSCAIVRVCVITICT